jgi:chromosome segregation ATPase
VPDATLIQPPGLRVRPSTGGTLRPSAALRRKRGLYGDVRYVFTALFGVRRSKQEVAELEHRQNLRQTSRRRHLVTLGRTAVITDTFTHPALGKAREQLQAIEDERSKHAGAVAASDSELERVRRDRETKLKQYAADVAATDAELADLGKKLEPLEKEATVARRKGSELRESLQRIDKKISETEALLRSVKGERLDPAAVQADIVTLKADRQAVLRDEPQIAADLDELNPRIAAMEAQRAELRKKRVELDKAEGDDQRRSAELLEAIGAKRKVVERAAGDAEVARDTALYELGDRLYVDRPKPLTAQLAPIDQIDLELGEGDRRIMELREIMSNIDKAKLARGLAMIILALGVVGSLLWILLSALF